MRLLIFGASGHLGGEIRSQAGAAGHETAGTGFRSADRDLLRVDVRDGESVAEAVDRFAPDAVVNAAYLQSDWATCALGPVRIARACVRAGARLVHVSSDAVFAGRPEPYTEDDDPSPTTPYGAAKAAAEVAVAAVDDRAAIARTSWILGDGDSGFERYVRDMAASGADGVLFDDDYRCAIHVSDLAAAVLELAGNDCSGVLNLGGADLVDRFELGRMVAERDGLDPAALRRGPKSSIGREGVTIALDSSRAGRLLKTRLRGASEFTA